jgi:hypothetical protein
VDYRLSAAIITVGRATNGDEINVAIKYAGKVNVPDLIDFSGVWGKAQAV